MVEHAPHRTKAEVIAKQNAEAVHILYSKHPPHRHLSPVYGSGINYIEFVCAAILGFVTPFGVLWFMSLMPTALRFPIQLAYGVAMMGIACASYLKLERAHAPSAAMAAIFTFSIVSALEIWVPLGGILTIIAAYFVLWHNGWLEG
jgi:hypothetical protein